MINTDQENYQMNRNKRQFYTCQKAIIGFDRLITPRIKLTMQIVRFSNSVINVILLKSLGDSRTKAAERSKQKIIPVFELCRCWLFIHGSSSFPRVVFTPTVGALSVGALVGALERCWNYFDFAIYLSLDIDDGIFADGRLLV